MMVVPVVSLIGLKAHGDTVPRTLRTFMVAKRQITPTPIKLPFGEAVLSTCDLLNNR